MQKMNNKPEQPTSLPIKKITQETDNIKTFYFDHTLNSKPGQFVLLWIPGVDQKPFGVSYQTGTEFAVTVSKVGPFTEKLFTFKEGDLVGVQGPYGTNFKFDEAENIAIIAA